jgi:hypothetical protein
MSFTIEYRYNIGHYEPHTKTIGGCTDVVFVQSGQWVSFKRNGKLMHIPACNVISVAQE